MRERSKAISPWFIGPVAVVVLGRLVPTQFWRSITVDIGWLGVLGIVVLVVSTAFTLWARAALGTMWTASAVVKDDHALRTDGPYAITRHPIYTGLLGMLAGTAAIEGLGRWVAYFVLAVLLVGLKIRTEERLLDRTLGGAYAQLVPGLRPIRR